MKGIAIVSILGVIALLSSVAQGEITSKSAASDGIDGLPGLYRVPIAGEAAPRMGVGLWANYGYTEPQNDETGSHHQLGASATVGGALWPFLSAAARVDVRHDIHPKDDSGKDDGTVIDFTPLLRFALPLGALRFGLEGRLLFSGATSQDRMSGPTPDGRVIASYVEQGWFVSGYVGARTAYNGHDSFDATSLRPGDRVALGISQYPAIMTGLGVMKEFRPVTLLGEVTWDILVGRGAPSVIESPLRLAVGARKWLIPGLAVQGIIELSPGKRAPSLPSDPLVPVAPRVAVILGISIRLPEISRKPTSAQAPQPAIEKEQPTPIIVPAQVAPPPPVSQLSVLVVDESGHPISDAHVMIEVPTTAGEPEQTVDVPLQELNTYVRADLVPGRVVLTIEADLLQSYSEEIALAPDGVKELKVTLRKAVGLEGQLRGLVRSYSGRGIAATIRVFPGDKVVSCSEQGEFELDLPPGTYSVMIEAAGYAAQKRPVRIRKDGVTVLNADLHQSN